MKSTCGTICALLKFPTSVQLCENYLKGAPSRLIFGMRLNVDTSSIVFVLMLTTILKMNGNAAGMTIDGLVDCIVGDFPYQMMKTAVPTPPIYMPGRLRTGSNPSRMVMSDAVCSLVIRRPPFRLGRRYRQRLRQHWGSSRRPIAVYKLSHLQDRRTFTAPLHDTIARLSDDEFSPTACAHRETFTLPLGETESDQLVVAVDLHGRHTLHSP